MQIVRDAVAAEASGTVPAPFPEMKDLQKLFLQKASVPGWWLIGLVPEERYELLTEVPRWLQRHAVFIMRNGVWRGRKGDKAVLLRDCPDRGLLLEFPEDIEEDRGDV